jgi:signal transduction histidine kinase
VLGGELERTFDASLVANAEHAAGALARDVAQSGGLRADPALLEQLASTGGRVLVLDASAAEIADSAPPGDPALGVTPAEIAAADAHVHKVHEVAVPGDVMRMTVQAVKDATGRSLGYVVWADSTEPLRGLLATVRLALVVGGVAITGLALVVGLVVARRALAPVADITDAARAIALSGDFGARLEGETTPDEVGELALAFNEMLAALEESHLALRRFLGDASHQLRTPLTTIRANLDLARRPNLAQDEREVILADARDEAERMGHLVADLLSLARAEAGTRIEFQPVELDALLIDAVRLHAQAAPHLRMTVGSVEPVLVEGDPDRLRELLGILLDNAGRYTPPGGSVVARVSVHDAMAIVTVEDTGVGIRDDEVGRVFERLFRGEAARRLRPSGTGLGLAIGRWIADAHGGTLRLANRADGPGAVATFSLPGRGDLAPDDPTA